MNCPNCGGGMRAERLDGHLGTSVTIDLCPGCQMFWFDSRENLKLSPGGVLTLFRLIGEQPVGPRPQVRGTPACPRCGIRLLATHDQQRSTRFQYLRCPRDHGRLETFVDFLREKDFIRPLSPEQIERLRESVRTVNCSNCGAPIDLSRTSSCGHCGSPLSMLDMAQAGTLIEQLRQAQQEKQTIDPALPLRLLQARLQTETAFAAFERQPGWFDAVEKGGLVAAGLSALARWMKEQT